MLQLYSPKKFGKEYVDLKSSYQYPMFVATALGVKSSFDDWIPMDKYSQFVEICSKYGLTVEPDVMFVHVKNKEFIGSENVTTTLMEGRKFNPNEKNGEVHVIIAKYPEIAKKSKIFGWYNVVTDGRSINKPFVDHLRFGRLLGFPECCVDFFRKYNNWQFFNHPFETYKNTPQIKGKKKASYYCNNIIMDNTYFYIHHLPCSFRCNSTIKYAKELEEKFLEVEPEFVEQARKYLKMPVLVFGEKNYVIFDGNLETDGEKEIIHYKWAQYHGNYARSNEKIDFSKEIFSGDTLVLHNNIITVYKENKEVFSIETNKETFILDFD